MTTLGGHPHAASTMPRADAHTIPAVPAATWPPKGARVTMIGIGGCGMSGLARMLRARGAIVGGSDLYPSVFTEALAADNFAVSFDQTAATLPDDVQIVVASAAVKPDHPQVLEAQRRGLPVLFYAEALGKCMGGSTGVAIAGTHGKSTTTAMLGVAMAAAGLDPSVIVGATCPQLGADPVALSRVGAAGVKATGGGFRLGAQTIESGALAGRPGLLVVEACEFNRSFHNYHPLIATITAVEADHLDIYGSLDAVVEAFRVFAQGIPSAKDGGVLLIADKGAHRREITAGLACDVQTIGFSPSADWVVTWDLATRKTTIARRNGAGTKPVASWVTPMPGEHNAMNAATAVAVCVLTGADPLAAAKAIEGFKGVNRRNQFLGERKLLWGGSVKVFDDYGHHPTEVDTTLRALRDAERPKDNGGRLICVFQPHQHSRTRHLLDEFAAAFEAADIVIVPHIYFVRDSIQEKTKVSAADLVDRLRAKGVQAMHLYPFEAIVEQLEVICRPGDVVVVMGAGPVDEVAKGFLAGGK